MASFHREPAFVILIDEKRTHSCEQWTLMFDIKIMGYALRSDRVVELSPNNVL